jgi:hypothetical protein
MASSTIAQYSDSCALTGRVAVEDLGSFKESAKKPFHADEADGMRWGSLGGRLFREVADPGTTARLAAFGETPEDGAPRLLHVRPMEPESTAETTPHTASQAHD